jgi:surface polysaccharide O-acyltransferase-like enzyme
VVEERVTITARETVVTRNAAADRLKVVLVCAVIVAHCAITYGADGGWFYHEGGDASVLADVLTVPLALGALFAMGAFFYVAGCFVPSSLDRKGIRRFAAERAVRLGIPVAAYVCVVVPAIEWLVAVTAGPRRTAADIWSDQLHELDTGPLWFVAALLIFSVVYATFTSLRRIPVSTTPLRVRTLLVCAATIAVLSFVLRIWFPIDTFQIGALHVWQWGQCLGLFALGAFLGQRGLTTFDHRVVVTCRWLLGIGALAVLLLIAAYSDNTDPLGGGLHWQSATVAVIEGIVSVSATVVLLDVLRRWRGRGSGELARRAFGAYVLQAPVIVVFALALRDVPVPGGVKLLLLAPASLAACFVLAGLLRRVRLLRRIV